MNPPNKPDNSLQNLINQAAKSQPTDLAVAAVQHHRHPAKIPHSGRRFVLADVSGSMSESAGGTAKIALLRKALSQSGICWSDTYLVAFGSVAEYVVTPGSLPSPAGGTALHRALTLIESMKPAHTLIISDGRPDSQLEALWVAASLTGVIDVLYVGPDDDHEALAFMQKLASRSGGRVQSHDLKRQPNRLETSIKGLLAAAR